MTQHKVVCCALKHRRINHITLPVKRRSAILLNGDISPAKHQLCSDGLTILARGHAKVAHDTIELRVITPLALAADSTTTAFADVILLGSFYQQSETSDISHRVLVDTFPHRNDLTRPAKQNFICHMYLLILLTDLIASGHSQWDPASHQDCYQAHHQHLLQLLP